MKKLILILLFAISISTIQAKNLSAFFSYSAFDIPGKSPYIETYLNVIGSSVKFIPVENNMLKGQIEVQWVIRSGDKIVHIDKYNLNSPSITAGDSLVPDFVDLQRINIEKGEYTVELSIRDKNTESKETTLKQNIHIGFPVADTISISDIEFVESYTKTINPGKFSKSGYDIVPYIKAFYPKEITEIKFYAEIYRSDIKPGEDYLIRYYISNKESQKFVDNYVVSKKQSPNSINVLMGEFSIVDLPSGNYYMVIEIKNKQNKLIALNTAFFQRSNERNKPLLTADVSATDITNTFISSTINKDTLVDYIACLYPISTNNEVEYEENQMNLKDTRSMQQYIYYFWSKRNPSDPESAWNDYKEEVSKVNYSYTSRIRKGYDTDRGRVYLQYGPPNIIADSKDDPAAYPYEIWHYYKLENQSNRKFVFYTTDLSANDYRLLHSDAIGEVQEPAWELKLHERTQQFGIDLDQQKSIDTYGSHSKEEYVNPH